MKSSYSKHYAKYPLPSSKDMHELEKKMIKQLQFKKKHKGLTMKKAYPVPPSLEEDTEMLKYIFVYGTLRTDMEYELRRIINYASIEGYGTIKADMFDLGMFPACIPGNGTVQGQLLSYNDKGFSRYDMRSILGELDMYEQSPKFFRRKRAMVMKEDGTEIEAWVYFFTNEAAAQQRPPVPSGDWKQHLEGVA